MLAAAAALRFFRFVPFASSSAAFPSPVQATDGCIHQSSKEKSANQAEHQRAAKGNTAATVSALLNNYNSNNRKLNKTNERRGKGEAFVVPCSRSLRTISTPAVRGLANVPRLNLAAGRLVVCLCVGVCVRACVFCGGGTVHRVAGTGNCELRRTVEANRLLKVSS